MKKTILLGVVVLFFSACHHATEQKPDADRVIKDTLAQILLRPFNETPNAPQIYVHVAVKETHFLCAHKTAIGQFTKAPPKHIIAVSVADKIDTNGCSLAAAF